MCGKEDQTLLRSISTDLNNLGVQLHLQGGTDDTALEMYQAASYLLASALDKKECWKYSLREAKEKLSLGRKRFESPTSRAREYNDISPSSGDEHTYFQEGKLTTRMLSRPVNTSTTIDGHGSIYVKNDLAKILHNMGLLFYKNNLSCRAQQLFELAIQTVADDCDNVFLVLATNNNLGHIAYCLGRHNDAVRHFSEALRLIDLDICERKREQQGPLEQHALHQNILMTNQAIALYAVGEGHEEWGMFDEAMMIFLRLLKTRQDHPCKVIDNSARFVYALAMRKVGYLYYYTGENEMCIQALESSLMLWKQALVGASENEDIASLLQDIGTAQRETGAFSKAMECFQESLRIRESLYGRNHAEVSNTLYYIGRVHQDKGNYCDALGIYSEVVRIEKIVFGQNHPEVAATLTKIGEVNQECGNMCDALKSYKEALRIIEQAQGELDSSLVGIHQAIGTILACQGNSAEARIAFSAAMRIEQALGQQHLSDISIPVKGIPSDLEEMDKFPGAAAA